MPTQSTDQTKAPAVEPSKPILKKKVPKAGATGLQGAGYQEGSDQLSPEDKERAAELKAYEHALGDFLGGHLYKLVSKELSHDRVTKHVSKGVEEALDAGVDLLKDVGETDSDKEALGKFGAVLDQIFKEKADAWLKTDNGKAFISKISDQPGTHPKTMVFVALLAAAGAVIGNVKLPKLKTKFNLGKGFDAKVEAKLGKIREIALESVKATLSYQKGKFQAGIEANRNADGAIAGAVTAKYGDDKRFVRGKGDLDHEGKLNVKLDGRYVKDAWTLAAEATGNKEGLSGARADVSHTEAGFTKSGGVQWRSEDGFSLNLGSSYTKDLWKFSQSSNVGLEGQGSSNSVGVGYGTDALRLELNGAINDARRYDLTGTASKFGGKLTGKPSDRTSFTADFEADATAGTMLSYGVAFGYEDPKKFQKYLLDYHRDFAGDVPVDRFMAHAQTRITDRFSVGGRANANLQDGHFESGKLDVLGGYDTTIGGEKVTWLLGAEQGFGPGGEMGATGIKAGVQVRGVPLTIKYEPETKTTSFQIELFKF
jgi:hypothetical protein